MDSSKYIEIPKYGPYGTIVWACSDSTKVELVSEELRQNRKKQPTTDLVPCFIPKLFTYQSNYR